MIIDLVLKGTYDVDSDTLYVQLPNAIENKAVSTMQINETTLADIDAKGNVIGLEVLFFSLRRKQKTTKQK